MENEVHRICLFLIYHPRIQKSLNNTMDAWNHHKIRTEHYRTPVALYELSREQAIQRGYWTGDPGDDLDTASQPDYGIDPEAPCPPASENAQDPSQTSAEPEGVADERAAGIAVNDDQEIQSARDLLADYDFCRDDGNWGIEVYCQAVILMCARLNNHNGYNNTQNP